MKREELVEKLRELYEENEEVFNHDIEELDWHNGCLGNNRWLDMDEIGEGISTLDALQRAFHGYDADSKEDDSQFCPYRSYYRWDMYFVSSDYKDYSDYLDEAFIKDIIDFAENSEDAIYLSSETQLLLFEYFHNKED